MSVPRGAFRTSVIVLILFATTLLSAQGPGQQPPSRSRVLVQLRVPDASGQRVMRGLGANARIARRFNRLPFVALEVGPAERAALNRSPEVVRVFDDEIVRPVLAQSVPLIQGDQAWNAGYDGTGTTIAILDTGVDAQHPFLAGKVVDEACFSSTVSGTSQSACPERDRISSSGPAPAAPCALADCLHGTHVAGIAAGNGSGAGVSFSGVATGRERHGGPGVLDRHRRARVRRRRAVPRRVLVRHHRRARIRLSSMPAPFNVVAGEHEPRRRRRSRRRATISPTSRPSTTCARSASPA